MMPVRNNPSVSVFGPLFLVAWLSQGCLQASPGQQGADTSVGPDVAPAEDSAPDGAEWGEATQGFVDLAAEAIDEAFRDATDLCISFELENGIGERVIARGSARSHAAAGEGGDGGPSWDGSEQSSAQVPVCSDQYGSRTHLSYVLPCDASPEYAANTVRVWVNVLCSEGTFAGGDCVPFPGFVNPCGVEGCELAVTCVENWDTALDFDF